MLNLVCLPVSCCPKVSLQRGVDVVSFLELLHIPDSWVEKIRNTPPSAGHFVVAAILYKIATPGRYATTLAGIQLAFWVMRRSR
ncbi:hypothetical protein L596_005030 [Steinernema carpocapsae]|uniref:DUF1279 domain-containing protein n=1 Tax=Steinernema carpocapsae TaxID=34508 RepID=A0A4U8UZ62_STECR|nr:hypothetical protein L596_005030 [Steinernema carpocapsae]